MKGATSWMEVPAFPPTWAAQAHMGGSCLRRTTWNTYADTHCGIEDYFRALTSLLQFPLCDPSSDVSVFVLLWQQDVRSYRQELNGAPNRRCCRLTNIWLSKQNPKYSFLSYHATQHEWNITCILLEGETRTTLLFPIDTADVLGEEGQREPEPWLDELRSD